MPLTAPVIGPVALLRKIGRATGGSASPIASVEPTGALNLGIKVIAQLGPLLGKIQMRTALAAALDTRFVPLGDQAPVLAIIDAAKAPADLVESARRAHERLVALWADTTGGEARASFELIVQVLISSNKR